VSAIGLVLPVPRARRSWSFDRERRLRCQEALGLKSCSSAPRQKPKTKEPFSNDHVDCRYPCSIFERRGIALASPASLRRASYKSLTIRSEARRNRRKLPSASAPTIKDRFEKSRRLEGALPGSFGPLHCYARWPATALAPAGTRICRPLDAAIAPVLWIGAGAGAGKTLGMAGYLAARQRASIWYEGDPGTLVASLATLLSGDHAIART